MSGFQLSGDAPTIYNRVGLKLLEPWTEDLIVCGKVRDGDRVLDLACGTGVVAGRVKSVTRKLCTVVGLDINEAMLGAARRIPDVEWQQGSVLKMPFSDSSFDVVLCQQGLQFFPDRVAAMREIARVLAPGGRLAASVWGTGPAAGPYCSARQHRDIPRNGTSGSSRWRVRTCTDRGTSHDGRRSGIQKRPCQVRASDITIPVTR